MVLGLHLALAASFPLKFQQKSGGGEGLQEEAHCCPCKDRRRKQANSQGNQGAGTWD